MKGQIIMMILSLLKGRERDDYDDTLLLETGQRESEHSKHTSTKTVGSSVPS